jgi:hypothetical protein
LAVIVPEVEIEAAVMEPPPEMPLLNTNESTVAVPTVENPLAVTIPLAFRPPAPIRIEEAVKDEAVTAPFVENEEAVTPEFATNPLFPTTKLETSRELDVKVPELLSASTVIGADEDKPTVLMIAAASMALTVKSPVRLSEAPARSFTVRLPEERMSVTVNGPEEENPAAEMTPDACTSAALMRPDAVIPPAPTSNELAVSPLVVTIPVVEIDVALKGPLEMPEAVNTEFT